MIGKCVLVVLDGVGAGAAPDADRYGDAGANTLAGVASAVGGLDVPTLAALGLGRILPLTGVPAAVHPQAAFGRMRERSVGKDSTTGHWELAGVLTETPFPTYPDGFPATIIDAFVERGGLDGVLCNAPGSGTELLDRFGPEHLATGKPIVYTSADSVFQVAAHEDVIGLDRLHELCRIARDLLTGPDAVGRVIARPFVGAPGAFVRTGGRRDYSRLPDAPLLSQRLQAAGIPTVALGKIDDLYAGLGFDVKLHHKTNAEGTDRLIRTAAETDHGFLMINLVDFDTLYGHRGDPDGFARALEAFDGRLPELLATLRGDDLLIITADHGNDPTFPGTDHTREWVPLLVYGPDLPGDIDLGERQTFADVGATVADAFGVPFGPVGRSFYSDLKGTPA